MAYSVISLCSDFIMIKDIYSGVNNFRMLKQSSAKSSKDMFKSNSLLSL